ncbi:MAG TPA: DUF1491 family protein [Acidocella sp.]|jgi:hypothetical protein|uniref:DUF1491 family protein n=1 Tax=Acidocella sp. TaxID=50710 RepID=UPI002C2EEEE4|nr:DUF1491 family protein [Acidocella sp.]HVE23739.1 DUF1491 family protein [Acidocella sp.]
MGEPRIKAGVWVSAVLRLGAADGKPGLVVHKGDPDAGGVLVVLHGRSGNIVLSQFRDAQGELAWMRGTGPEPVSDTVTDAYVKKQISYDSDLWVIEFDAADYLPPFEGKIV